MSADGVGQCDSAYDPILSVSATKNSIRHFLTMSLTVGIGQCDLIGRCKKIGQLTLLNTTEMKMCTEAFRSSKEVQEL